MVAAVNRRNGRTRHCGGAHLWKAARNANHSPIFESFLIFLFAWSAARNATTTVATALLYTGEGRGRELLLNRVANLLKIK